MKKYLLVLGLLSICGLAHATPTIYIQGDRTSLQTGTTVYISSGTINTLYTTTMTPTHIVGTTTNDSATGGTYGEFLSSTTSNGIFNCGTSNAWVSVATMSLTSGDWECNGAVNEQLNGATTTAFSVALSTFTGNTTTDMSEGYNQTNGGPAASYNQTTAVAGWRLSVASPTNIFLKMRCTFSAGTPRATAWSESCRRDR